MSDRPSRRLPRPRVPRPRVPLPRVPGPVLAFARAVGLPVSETTRYWVQERSALARGLVALVVAALADLTAGIVLSRFEGDIEALPGLLVLIPAAIAMRGATFGSLGARLGTAIHTGQYEPSLRRGGYLWLQLEAVGVLTLVTSLEAAVIAWLFARVLGRPTIPLTDLVTISVVGGVLASVVLVFVTLGLATASYGRGWNMDDVGAPAITATGDLLAIPALLLATFAAALGVATTVVAVVLAAATVAAGAYGWFHPRRPLRRLIRESTSVMTLAATVSVLAGLVLEARRDVFLGVPALLVLFPAFVAMFGSLGGILSSRLTSKLHLGLVAPSALPGKLAALDFSVTYLFGLVIFAFVAVATQVAAVVTGTPSPGLGSLVAVSILGGVAGTVALSVVAYAASTATFRFGLDPDNHAIPIVTSTMDFVGMLCLVGAMAVVGVG